MAEIKGADLTVNDFSYFIGGESEQFNFIKVPKLFFTNERFEKLSYGAKILYGLLLDRMNLSKKNKWLDVKKRVYVIYTIQSIGEDFHVSQTVAVRLLKELEEFGLIEKKKRPNEATMIYVKNFILSTEEKSSEILQEQGIPENGIPELQNMEFQKMEPQNGLKKQGIPENGIPELQNMEFQKVESNKTKDDDNITFTSSSSLDRKRAIMFQIMTKINYQKIIVREGVDKELVDRIIRYLTLLYLSPAQKYKVSGSYISKEEMQKKIYESITEENIMKVVSNITINGTETIYNLKSYIYTCLYNLVNIKKMDKVPSKLLSRNKFTQLKQNSYDFEKLEEELLAKSFQETKDKYI